MKTMRNRNENLQQLSDDEILEGFKDGDAAIVKEYYYGYCRIAYCIYDKQYDLRSKPGMDFFSLAHEYYMYLCEHHFKPLEDRKPTMSLKTWMVNGFRFLLLDKQKGAKKEHLFESFDKRQENSKTHLDAIDGDFRQELQFTIEEICHTYYGRDSKNSLILQMLFIEGFKGNEVAAQLGMTPSAVTQRCNKMMHDVVVPYFKEYFMASEYDIILANKCYQDESICFEMAMPDGAAGDYTENVIPRFMTENRITPEWIDSLKENEVFVFGSNLAGLHGGGAARVARLRFGAVMGNGVGMQGQSYAIPTMQGGVETIRPYVADFIADAKANPDKQFLVTPIGCGIAGFEPKDIAPLFEEAKTVQNISLPQSFWKILGE